MEEENGGGISSENVQERKSVPRTAVIGSLLDRRLYNVVVLGICFMLIFSAFQTTSMAAESVIEGAKNSTGGQFKGNGYTSLAVIYSVFSAANWIAPSIVSLIGPKFSMVIGAVTYVLYIMSFLKPMTWAFYLASVLVGIGAAVIWTAQGNFLTINSDSETVGRNSGIFWALLQCSLLFGNIYVYFAFQGEVVIQAHTRTTVFLVLSSVCGAGTLLLIFLRSKVPVLADDMLTQSSQSEVASRRDGPVAAFINSFKLLTTKQMALLCVPFAYTGFELTFFSGVYGTSVGHTQAFGTDAKSYLALCGIFIGVGEIIGGLVFGLLGSRTNRFGRDPIVCFGFVVHIAAFYLIFLNLPAHSPIGETTDPSYITSNRYIAFLCGFLLGLGDSSFNTQIYSLLGFLFTENSAPAFALFKFVQSVAAAIGFFYSNHLLLQYQLLICTVFAFFGFGCFTIVERNAMKIYKSGYTRIDWNNNDSDVEDAYDSLCNTLRVENGVDVAQRNKAVAKFITCSSHGDAGTLELLLKSGTEVSRSVLDVNLDESGWLPIHAACQMGFIEVLKFLHEMYDSRGLGSEALNIKGLGGCRPLHVACSNDNFEVIRYLAYNGADVSATSNDGSTPLHVACKSSINPDIVHLLVECGANINATIPYDGNVTPLDIACFRGHVQIVKILAQNGANLFDASEDKSTPLHVACKEGHSDIAKLLVKFGAVVNCLSTNDGETPLLISCKKGFSDIVEFLLEYTNADTEIDSYDNLTPIYVSCKEGYTDIVKLLVRHGADVNRAYKNMITPLSIACQKGYTEVVGVLLQAGALVNGSSFYDHSVNPLYKACIQGFSDIVKLLIKGGGDVNAEVCDGGKTLLFVASQLGLHDMVRHLVENGAKVNTSTTDGSTPLLEACKGGHTKVAKILITHKAHVNSCYPMHENGLFPLYVACKEGHAELVELLLKCGANPNVCRLDGSTPLYIATKNKHEPVVSLLAQYGAIVNPSRKTKDPKDPPLCVACHNRDLLTAKCLIQSGADVNSRDLFGANPLHIASINGHIELVKLLIEWEAIVDTTNFCNEGETPLFIACKQGDLELVKILVQAGALANVSCDDGTTPLFIACQQGHHLIVKYLIQMAKGLTVNRSCDDGTTPLFMACQEGHMDIVTLLIESGSSVHITRDDNASPLFIACHEGHLEVVKFLILHKANVNILCDDGASPLYAACLRDHVQVVKYLLQCGAEPNPSLKRRMKDTPQVDTPLTVASAAGNLAITRLLIKAGANVNPPCKTCATPLCKASAGGHLQVVKLLVLSGALVNSVCEEHMTPLSVAHGKGHTEVVEYLLENGANEKSCIVM